MKYGDTIIGKTIETVEIRDDEVLLTFKEGGEISITPCFAGGDYNTFFLQTIISPEEVNSNA